jgi:predicted nucleotidyltransferase component of viral defense system
MRYTSARGFRAAIEARLLDASRNRSPEALSALRKQVAFDRFLARMIEASPAEWMLKGGTALYVRMPDHYRFTQDLDLVVAHQPAHAVAVVQEAIRREMDDYFSFQIIKSRHLDLGDEANTVRFTLRSRLDGRLFEDVTVDVGFDTESPFHPDTIEGSDLLQFSGIPRLAVPTLPIEIHLAEKLHAYSKNYGPSRTNTRVKDLVDMVLIAETHELSASRMHRAIGHTFGSRVVQTVPPRLGPPPAAWGVPYAALARSVSLEPDMTAAHAFAASMFDPLLTGTVVDATWLPGERRWHPAVPTPMGQPARNTPCT